MITIVNKAVLKSVLRKKVGIFTGDNYLSIKRC